METIAEKETILKNRDQAIEVLKCAMDELRHQFRYDPEERIIRYNGFTENYEYVFKISADRAALHFVFLFDLDLEVRGLPRLLINLNRINKKLDHGYFFLGDSCIGYKCSVMYVAMNLTVEYVKQVIKALIRLGPKLDRHVEHLYDRCFLPGDDWDGAFPQTAPAKNSIGNIDAEVEEITDALARVLGNMGYGDCLNDDGKFEIPFEDGECIVYLKGTEIRCKMVFRNRREWWDKQVMCFNLCRLMISFVPFRLRCDRHGNVYLFAQIVCSAGEKLDECIYDMACGMRSIVRWFEEYRDLLGQRGYTVDEAKETVRMHPGYELSMNAVEAKEIDPEELKFKTFTNEFIEVVNVGIERSAPIKEANDLTLGLLESFILREPDKERLLKFMEDHRNDYTLYCDLVEQELIIVEKVIKFMDQNRLIEIFDQVSN